MTIKKPIVIDNFLDEKIFKDLSNLMLSDNFDWYYNNFISYENEKLDKNVQNYQFIHMFYKENYGITGHSFSIIEPILKKLNIKLLIRVKANLNPKTEVAKMLGSYHVDSDLDSTTAIFYVNTNNGFTKFENGDVVNCVSNRIVLFHSSLRHVGFSCTDKNLRVVTNINFLSN